MISQSSLVVFPGGGNIPCHGHTKNEVWVLHDESFGRCTSDVHVIVHHIRRYQMRKLLTSMGKLLRHRVDSSPGQSILCILLASQCLCWYIPGNLD
jgi:hypothetical protein